MIDLYNGDCLEVMDRLIAEGIVVDAIICDPPYGTTACKWDSVIPFPEMWGRLNKLIKPNGAIVLFGSEPFSSALRMSNIKNYKYDWVWEKDKASNFMLAKKQVQKYHENILIFYNKQCVYNPIMWDKGKVANTGGKKSKRFKNNGYIENKSIKPYVPTTTMRYPKSIQKFNTIKANDQKNGAFHPTQKPIELMEYLIKTYTNENELVLDFTMGSGSTGVACKNTNRNFIGIELDEKYFKIAEERICKTH